MTKQDVSITTPHGHRVEAQVNQANFQVEMARVIAPTGVRMPLSQDTINNIAELVRNNVLHAQAINELGQVFSNMPAALRNLASVDKTHPGVAPYFRNEIEPHTQIIERTAENAEQLRLRIGTEADMQLEKPDHGLSANLRGSNNGGRSV